MPIDITYRELLLEEMIRDKLESGEVPNAIELTEELDEITETLDLTKPQFVASNHFVAFKEESSASKFNNAFADMRNDVRVLYREMIKLTSRAINSFERWKLEADILEKRLIDLEDHVDDLLLLIQDTEGYHSFVIDNFSDNTLVDLDLTTAKIDPVNQLVTLADSSSSPTRIFLNEILPEDVTFKVRTSIDFVSRVDGVDTDISNVFKQTSHTWWTQIEMRKIKPVTCELVVKIAEEPIPVSKITLSLHDSAQSSPITVTPLYSEDNYNYFQLPTNTFSQELRSTGAFVFPETNIKYFKFLLTKVGPDPGITDRFAYQFGFKEIAFFNEGFTPDTVQKVISRPLFVLENDGTAKSFSKLTLEVCERVETGTSIDYYITASNDPEVPVDENTNWFAIDPVSRVEPVHPVILDFGDVTDIEISSVGISYSGRETDTDFINPSNTFHLLSRGSSTYLDEEITTPTAPRYSFLTPNERLLNYQIKDTDYTGSGSGDALSIDEDNIVIFRNKGSKGLEDDDITSKVRDVQKGWRFEDPYYITVVEILNPDGLSMDVGNSKIIIDDVMYTNKIDPTVLSGRTSTQTGIHTVKVHKDNWVPVDPELNSLSSLQIADPLYPYNHKLLIEGYLYGDSYPTNEPKIYVGVDLFAELLMRQTNLFSLTGSVADDDYRFFALDRDAPNTHDAGNSPTRVFVVKVDETNPDFQNEEFVLRLDAINQRYQYFRLRADLSTEDDKIAPALDAYKIKLGA